MTGGIEAPEWVTVADWLWHAALREMDPAPGPDKPYREALPDSDSEYPRVLVQAVVDYLSEDLTCDHSVNICMCGTSAVVSELMLNMKGKRTCPQCSGDGFVYNKEKYEAAKAKYLAEWRGEMWWDIESEGYEDCARCNKTGSVDI